MFITSLAVLVWITSVVNGYIHEFNRLATLILILGVVGGALHYRFDFGLGFAGFMVVLGFLATAPFKSRGV